MGVFISGVLRQLGGVIPHWREKSMKFHRFEIALPPDHKLPELMRAHKHYDRFLPALARQLSSGGTFVDIGANCGDTLGAVANANPTLKFVCVEPSSKYLKYLRRNVAAIVAKYPGISIQIFDLMIGAGGKWSRLQTSNSTAAMIVVDPGAEGAERVHSFDEAIAPHLSSRIAVLKSDIDGYDGDAIASALGTIAKDQPIIFMECFFCNDDQKRSIIEVVQSLKSKNYAEFGVFDNFGNFILWFDAMGQLENLLEYVARQNQGSATRTINYFDIVATTKEQRPLIERALAEHLAS